jgi:NodT family efflux transporter outer membrane factor (OMF) lipoprotein
MKPPDRLHGLFGAAAAKSVLLVPCALLFASCNLAPRYNPPVVQTPPAFKELVPAQARSAESAPAPASGNWKMADPCDDAVRGKWWEMFHEPELNALEEQAALYNQSVAASLANFLAARAVVKQVRSQYFPLVATGPSVSRARQSGALAEPGSPPRVFTATEYALPFDTSWEADLWGRIRNSVLASSAEAQATLADFENVRLTVQAEVAADYFQLRVLDEQKRLLDATVLVDGESLKLTQTQLDTGIASGQDIELAATQLEIARAQSTDVGILRAQLEHAVAMLLGKPASTFSIAVDPLTLNVVAVPPGVPSRLLERRADIAAAERRVAEANAQIGVARAASFPTLTVGASAAAGSTSLGNLLSGPSLIWAVGAELAQTLFDAGKRKAVTAQARAVYQGTVANYRETVLTAFQEVEDDLSTLRLLSQELEQQNAAVESSRRYLALASDRYQAGLDDYLDVIAAQTILLTNRRTALNLRSQQMTASVQLIKALGGGWDASQLPSARALRQ